MADLTFDDKELLEQAFIMSAGGVLDFSNRRFRDFVLDATGKDIESGHYDSKGESKAKRLRAFWEVEPSHVVGKLLSRLLDYATRLGPDPVFDVWFAQCRSIAERLNAGAPVPELGAITPHTAERDLELLAREVKAAIDANRPEAGIDRLHTYTVKYIRRRCAERGIPHDRSKPLHSVFGEYANALKAAGLIDSKMGVQIIRGVGRAFEAYNDVRNNQSLAHDNPVLGYDEALLIYNHVCGVIRFLNAVDAKAARKAVVDDEFDGIPF